MALLARGHVDEHRAPTRGDVPQDGRSAHDFGVGRVGADDHDAARVVCHLSVRSDLLITANLRTSWNPHWAYKRAALSPVHRNQAA